MNTLDNVSISTKANVYFDGKCISHNISMADGSKKSIGVIFPSKLTFTTGAPETMEIISGKCRVRLAGSDAWQDYQGGQQFKVSGNAAFDIDTSEMIDYICHFG